MNTENTEIIRQRVLALIESEFDSDAAFERATSLNEKTVNNWRRGRSASFMKMLPTLSRVFGVNVGEMLGVPLRKDTSELSEDEIELLLLYRKARFLPQKSREALKRTLESTIELYISSAENAESGRKKHITKL